ncbi:SIS domain-containing protein [Kineococcus aurantiacus]|uniref:Fructoselysine-6-phosphate deglycase n=1 Tax=Kineococcus aurantiacus TaxID=37633 RepID=A0A7Y9DM89_9ACTN|nr:SIS domain-containing protein [Kineococcus aurantiacus]NYD23222.1 fructoselysine-6-phosphate deglycase [Kineococcus aurantiacus]
MLNFDEERFVRIQSGAVGLAGQLHRAVADALEAGAQNLFFLGAGGVTLLTHPAARLLQTTSTFPVHLDMAAELVVRDNVHLGPQSLVVMPSLSGTTKEAVEALEFCRAKGARVLTLTGHADTPMAQLADVNFTNFAEDDTSSESYYLQTLLIALSVMHLRGEHDAYPQTVAELEALPAQLVEVKRAFESRAAEIARTIKDEPYHVITAAGSAWPEAYYYGMCILEEMQWIRTRPVHASDFFHGTLELVEAGVSVVVLKGEDETRPLAERVEKFVPDHTEKLLVLDTADFELPGTSAAVRALVSPVLLATALERLSAHLEVLRDHPLTTRRYYRRLDY